MSRYFRNRFRDWREWQMFHDAFTKIAGLCLLVFLSLCFWNIYQRAEPTTISMALLAFMTATGMLFNGGRLALNSWLHRQGETNFQQTTTTTALTTTPPIVDVDPPVNPASLDDDK
jgi:hypothetical protein